VTKCLICLASAVGLLVLGCAVINPNHSQAVAISEDVPRVGGKAPRPGEDAVYFILAAELAGQRGQYDVALDNYLKASTLTQDVKILQRATQIALYLKKTDKALQAASLWLQRQPNSLDAQRLTAFLLLKSGRTDEALEQLTTLLNRPGQDVETTMIDLVKVLSADVSKDDGIKLMRRLGERFPRMAELHFASALLASDQGEYQTALDETEIALSHHPDWSRVRLLQAQVMSKMGDSQKAREYMGKAMQADPGNLRLRLIYSQYLAKAGDTHAAAKELEKILVKEPRNEEALLGLALAQLEMGQEAKAQQGLMRLADSPNRRMEAYFYLGLIEARKKNLQNAVQWFDKVSDGPAVLDARVNAITSLIYQGETEEARQRLAEARKQFPLQAVRLYLLDAELLTKDKNYAEAFNLLSRALEENHGQTDLLYARALVAEKLNRVEVLEADLQAVLEKKPDDANALNALGFTLADRSERLEEAKRYIARALQIKPDEPAILDSYGWVHYRLGDKAMALKYLGRAYDLLKDAEIGAHLGEVLWESGKRNDAKTIWMELLRKNPDNDDIKKVMARYPEAFK
jgi:tetratricopeptide (TPR) repeat protein